MATPDPSLIFAFAAFIGGLVAYVAVFALLTNRRPGPSKRPDVEPENTSDATPIPPLRGRPTRPGSSVHHSSLL